MLHLLLAKVFGFQRQLPQPGRVTFPSTLLNQRQHPKDNQNTTEKAKHEKAHYNWCQCAACESFGTGTGYDLVPEPWRRLYWLWGQGCDWRFDWVGSAIYD